MADSVLESGAEPGQRWICSQCCGKGRGRTIDCPDDCPHYRAGARAALLKLAELGGGPDTEIRYGEVLHNLRLGLVRLRRERLPDMKDSDARQAFANAADTMRTRASGLIFDFRSPDLRVQMIGDVLLSVATLHERGEKGMVKTDATSLMQCLKYLELQAAAAEKQAKGDTFLLDVTAQAVSEDFLRRAQEGIVRGQESAEVRSEISEGRNQK